MGRPRIPWPIARVALVAVGRGATARQAAEVAGLTDVEADLRAFVRDVHPEMEDQLWGAPGYLGIKMTRESGWLRMQLLDEFVAYEPPAAASPVQNANDVTDRLAAAVEEAFPDTYANLTYQAPR